MIKQYIKEKRRKKMNECLKQKIKEYIKKMGLDQYSNVYIPNHIIETFKKECKL